MWGIKILVLIFGVAVMGMVEVEGASKVRTAAIADLKELLQNELKEDYMKEDYWLGKWLVKKNYNVEQAVQQLRQHLQWREQEKVASILDEDWSDMKTIFPYTRDTSDKEGRPLMYIPMGTWDIAAYLASEGASSDRLIRYSIMLAEESEAHVRNLRANGQDVEQYNYIMNMAGFSTSTHLCIQCLYVSKSSADILTAYMPIHMEKVVLVNVPYLFKSLYYFFSDETQSYLNLYGQDRDQWEPLLLENIEMDQFPAGIMNQLGQRDNTEGFMMWKNKEL